MAGYGMRVKMEMGWGVKEILMTWCCVKTLQGMLDLLILAAGMSDSFTVDDWMQNEKEKILDAENRNSNKAGSGLTFWVGPDGRMVG